MKVINEVSVQASMATLNQMAIAKVAGSDFTRCELCRVSDG